MTMSQLVRIGLLILNGAGVVVTLLEVRRAWRIIPPSMIVPIRWRSAVEGSGWPKPIALVAVAAFGLTWNVFLGLTVDASPDATADLIPLVGQALLAICGPASVTILVRDAIRQLRKDGRRLRV